MKKMIRDIAEGSAVYVQENGTRAKFVVAKKNFESELNGNGKTLLVRGSILSDQQTMRALSWARDPSLRPWLTDTYAQRLDADFRAHIAAVSCRAIYCGSYYTLTGQTYLIPSECDIDAWTQNVVDTLGASIGYGVTFQLRDGYDEAPWNSDDEGDYYGQAYYNTAGSKQYFRCTATDGPNNNILPCFCVDEQVAVDEDGSLRANHAPEIVSNYLGKDGLVGKWTAFALPYRIYDADSDTVTVTEKLDGKVLRKFTAIQNGTYKISVTAEMLAALSTTQDHELIVTATDGFATTSKNYRFSHITEPGYIIYAGKISGKGNAYYWTERTVLHNVANESAPVALEPELTLEVNELGQFVFTLPATHPYCDKLTIKKTVISVEEDGNEIFMGYVTEFHKNFDMDIEVTCEGELGYLQDRDCQTAEKFYTTTELLTLALEADSAFAAEGKAFLPGNVTVNKPSSDEDKDTAGVAVCWDVVKNNLADKYGGYLQLRKVIKMENGVRYYTRYLDYLADIDTTTGQTIELGKNLLDIDYDIRSNQIVNSVKVIGWETTGWLFFTSTQQISVTLNYDESIARYGLCQRIIVVEGTSSTQPSLEKRGREELEKYKEQFIASIEINAADLNDVGVDCDRLGFMKKTAIISAAHGLSDWVLCSKEVIPLDAPEDKKFTFGATTSRLSSKMASNFTTAGKAWSAIQSTIRYTNSGGA